MTAFISCADYDSRRLSLPTAPPVTKTGVLTMSDRKYTDFQRRNVLKMGLTGLAGTQLAALSGITGATELPRLDLKDADSLSSKTCR